MAWPDAAGLLFSAAAATGEGSVQQLQLQRQQQQQQQQQQKQQQQQQQRERRQQQQRRQQQHLPSCCAPRAAAAAPQPQPQPRSPAAPQTRKPPLASRSRRRHEARPGPRLLDAALRCVARLLLASLKSVQDQVSKTPVVVECKVQGLAPAGGSSSNSTREPPASDRVAPVKVLDKWPLRGGAGGLQRDQVISVGSCVPLERNQRYIFFLEPTEQPLVFKTAFAPVDPNGKNIKKEVGKILCTDCESFLPQPAGNPAVLHLDDGKVKPD
ncbi:hypothetical protein STEG23_002915 [Scotinomys teguina]